MAVNKIEIQDENGDIYYPHTDSSVVFNKRGSSVNNELSDINSKLTHTQTEDLLVKQRILNSYLNKGGLKLTNVNDPSKNSYDGYWIDNGVLKVGASDKTRVKTPIIKITKAMDVTFDFPGYEWCSAKCSDASGNGASWDKLYAGGPTHHFEPGYQALLFKHNTGRELSEAEKSRLVLSFYDEIYSSTTTAMVNKLNANTNGYDLIFPFITDIHHFPTDDLKWSGKVKNNNIDHLQGLIELSNKFPIDFSVIGGDMSYDWTTMSIFKPLIQDVSNRAQRANSPVYFLAGNHDFGDAYNYKKTGKDAVLSPAQLNILLGRAVSNTMYYYKDFPQQKVRLIFLNTDDNYILLSDGTTKYPRVPNGNDDETIHVVGNEQGKWLSEALRTPDEGWAIIFMSHVPLRAQTQNSQAIADLINARKNKTSKTFTKTNSNTDFSWEFKVDYSKEYDVDIVGWISGHTHSDAINNFNNIKVITVTQAMGDNTGLGRENIDPTKTTFDVFCLDRANRKLDIKRFGNVGTDRSITY